MSVVFAVVGLAVGLAALLAVSTVCGAVMWALAEMAWEWWTANGRD
jgi:hypothetical protein